MRFEQITIVGVGLIGGSFGLAARRAGVANRIAGCDTAETLELALALGVIDAPDESFECGRQCDADLVYLAAPVGGILNFIRTKSHLLKPGAVVTDAGSTKREICRTARESLPGAVSFVGGHPMAGSEKSGVEFANPDLFREAPYALISTEGGASNATAAVRDLVLELGARPVHLTAAEHDRIVARVSHAPQMLATALALAASEWDERETLGTAGSGFADIARVAQSRWSVWEDICRTNADEIARALDETIREIEAVQGAIASGDFSGVRVMFQTANELMHRFHQMRKKG